MSQQTANQVRKLSVMIIIGQMQKNHDIEMKEISQMNEMDGISQMNEITQMMEKFSSK